MSAGVRLAFMRTREELLDVLDRPVVAHDPSTIRCENCLREFRDAGVLKRHLRGKCGGVGTCHWCGDAGVSRAHQDWCKTTRAPRLRHQQFVDQVAEQNRRLIEQQERVNAYMAKPHFGCSYCRATRESFELMQAHVMERHNGKAQIENRPAVS
jgi:hypothetical protein